MHTRWGRSRPLQKCIGLSLFAHLLFGIYATTVKLVGSLPPQRESYVNVAFVEPGDSPPAEASERKAAKEAEKPWEEFPAERVTTPDLKTPKPEPAEPLPEPQRRVRAETDLPPGAPPAAQVDPAPRRPPEPKLAEITPAVNIHPSEINAQPIQAPLSQRREDPDLLMPSAAAPRPPLQPDTLTEASKTTGGGIPSSLLQPVSSSPFQRLDGPAAHEPADTLPDQSVPSVRNHSPGTAPLPEAYKLRTMPNRFDIAQRHGATAQTEKAVQAALKWLAANQAPDGRWDAGDHEAGLEQQVLGRDRQNAGSQADSAVTGLALLAFLASGNTHRGGDYRENVRRGLEYLISVQGPDGNLGGKATIYEMMYAHSMAACALSEAYGMTRDPRLREPVRRAIDYIVKTQDPKGGGWRYLPHIPGDTSQLGWQVMALKSAELAGIVMPNATRQGIIRFLQNVSAGKHGGLASYRPGEQVTRAMSAEALVCWQFLGLPREHPACNEAGNYLLGELPGQDVKPNDYYWYYATLAMYQLQGEYWRRWNEAMHTVIVQRQVEDGPLAGSWNTDTLWGGYGGRVYTTAIAALTLEVYYRYLPLYADAVIADRRAR
jgi:hypothetical protein